MKLQTKGPEPDYCSPVMVILDLFSEGVLCASDGTFETYDGLDDATIIF